MNFDEARGAAKKAEIAVLLGQALSKHVAEADDRSAAAILEHFATVAPPEAPQASFRFITLYDAGDGGGRSTKPGNVRLNMRKLAAAVSSGTLTVVGATSAPWLVLLAGLVIWDSLWSALQVDIGEVEAAVLWALWRNRDDHDTVRKGDVLGLVNTELKNRNRPVLTPGQVDDALLRLRNLGCIETSRSAPDGYWLREWVQIAYR